MTRMIRPTCPGSHQPVSDGATVIVTRIGVTQQIGRCRHCEALVLAADGVAIEHLLEARPATVALPEHPERFYARMRTVRERLAARRGEAT